jgi:hypothetical protein
MRVNTVGRNSTLSWGDPLICSLPGRYSSTRWERGQLKDFSCLAPSTGKAACPPETVCCSTSSSSALWWITHFQSGCPLPAATYVRCKCYNPSVFALRLTHLGKLVTGKFKSICVFDFSPTTSEHWLRASTQSLLCGKHLSSATWKALWSHPRVTEVGWCSAGQPSPSQKEDGHVDSMSFSATLTEVFRAFPQL